MCGLIGFVRAAHTEAALPEEALMRGRERMRARGPDADGAWRDTAGGAWLGHRRLAILDLDARANQPMLSADGRYAIAYNGEIYNFLQLRAELESTGVQFQTRSDTEVLLALYAREGEAMLQRLRGMFAIAIWDAHARRLFVARDPYGIKPLYIAKAQGGWIVASQVKAILATGLVARTPDALGQAGFWLLGSVPEPHGWFADIRPLPAGHCTVIDAEGPRPARAFWDIREAWLQAGNTHDDTALQAEVREALLRSVHAHLVADVPVGVFLSGGIDSGALAALMHEVAPGALQGVTVGFDEFSGALDDEVPDAAALAARYGMSHHVRRVQRDEFERDLPAILDAMDQPSVDGINTWYASKAVAEQGLKVVVSGIGGDELFQGYSGFRKLPALVARWRRLARIPGASAAASLAAALQARRTGNARWQHLPRIADRLAGAWWLQRGVFAPEQLDGLMGRELAAQALAQAADAPADWVASMAGPLPQDPRLSLGLLESVLYLRNQLLRDSDWASMAHGVELRTPLVDAWLLRALTPWLGAFERFPGKRLLAVAPRPPLEEGFIARPKTGFGTPVSRWLREGGHASEETGSPLARLVAQACYGD